MTGAAIPAEYIESRRSAAQKARLDKNKGGTVKVEPFDHAFYPDWYVFHLEEGERAGEVYSGYVRNACQDPTCGCGSLAFVLRQGGQTTGGLPATEGLADSENNGKNEEPYRFFVNLGARKLTPRQPDATRGGLELGPDFAAELSEEQWNQFQQLFAAQKAELIRNHSSLGSVRADLSHLEPRIEEVSEQVLFSDVFPFSDSIRLSGESGTYLVLDHYCLRQSCTCRDVTLVFYRDEETPDEPAAHIGAVTYDYRKENWDWTESPSAEARNTIPALLDQNAEEMARIARLCSERHRILRQVYRNYRRRKERPGRFARSPAGAEGAGAPNTTGAASGAYGAAAGPGGPGPGRPLPASRGPKVGRNAPCPCGSGRKFKHCCGRAGA